MAWFRDYEAELRQQYSRLVKAIAGELAGINDRLASIEKLVQAGGGSADLTELTQRVEILMASVDRIESSVDGLTTVGDGMVTLLGQLSELIRAADPNNPRLNALADKVDAKKVDWAQAVINNTPAAASEPPVEQPVT